MNKDTIKGAGKRVEGAVESAYGKVTGDKSAELKGEAKKLAGKAQQVYGNAKDKLD